MFLIFKKQFKKVIIWILKIECKVVLFLKKPKIIAIGGCIGKTTTKDILYTGLKNFINVRKSQKSFNSDIGVLLTILNLETGKASSVIFWLKNILKGFFVIFSKNYPKFLILEVGADRPKEIENSSKLIKADIVILTRLPEILAHIEFFNNRQEFVDEELSLAKFSKKKSIIFYNNNDETLLKELKKDYFFTHKKKTYGKNGDYFFNELKPYYENEKLAGIRMKVMNKEIILSGTLGNHLGYPVSALCGVADYLNLDFKKVLSSLEEDFIPTAGRMRLLNGIKNTIIIDDSYNALPESIHNGAEILSNIKTYGRKIYVLGRLAELGKYTEESYKEAVKYIREGCDILFLVNDGGLALKYAEKLNFKELHSFNNFNDDYLKNTREVGEFLKNYLDENDVIIFKGSRHSTAFEIAIAKILKNIKDKKFLIQDYIK